MRDTGARIAGRLDHDVDAFVNASVAAGVGKSRARDASGVPANILTGMFGALDITIADQRDVEAFDARCLRQKHRAEFSGADQSDTDRFSGIDPRGEESLQAHSVTLAILDLNGFGRPEPHYTSIGAVSASADFCDALSKTAPGEAGQTACLAVTGNTVFGRRK
jgi:hypothetical protein